MKKVELRITNPLEAQAVLGYVNKSSRYKIDTSQYDEISSKRREFKYGKVFINQCEEQHIKPENVKLYWDKTDNFSILVKPNEPEALSQEQFNESLIEILSDYSPKYKELPRTELKTDNILVVDIADAHFGKLCSSYETGESYNIEIAKRRCIDGVSGIISKASGFGIDKVVLVVGNDVLHYDNPRRTTTSGTPQDTDVMFYDMFEGALQAHVEIIEALILKFDVDIIFCPSNHDYQSGWNFAQTLKAWFRTSNQVNVDASISHRKYYNYGTNLIGLSHGDGAKMENMPLLMANEVPQLWANTKFRYVYLHHIHHKQRNHFQSGKDFIGVTVEYLRSPSSSDSWHYRNGYVGAKKAIEGFIHNKVDGQIARLSHYF